MAPRRIIKRPVAGVGVFQRPAYSPISFRPVVLRPLPKLSPVALVDDRRFFHPLGVFRPPLSLAGGRIKPIVISKAPQRAGPNFLSAGVSFAAPKSVSICFRRKARREVIFANGKAGKGSRSRRRRRTWFSDVGC